MKITRSQAQALGLSSGKNRFLEQIDQIILDAFKACVVPTFTTNAFEAGELSILEEVSFCDFRKWRFDRAIPELSIAVEYEGINSSKSRHTTIVGFSDDCEKYGIATILGWFVYRFTMKMVDDGRAAHILQTAIRTGWDIRHNPKKAEETMSSGLEAYLAHHREIVALRRAAKTRRSLQ